MPWKRTDTSGQNTIEMPTHSQCRRALEASSTFFDGKWDVSYTQRDGLMCVGCGIVVASFCGHSGDYIHTHTHTNAIHCATEYLPQTFLLFLFASVRFYFFFLFFFIRVFGLPLRKVYNNKGCSLSNFISRTISNWNIYQAITIIIFLECPKN